MHPMLLTNPDGVARARARCNSRKWARRILDRLLDEAQDLNEQSLPEFETDWWQEASTRHWTETYPEISRHTFSAVEQPCRAARNAAIAYAASGRESAAEAVVNTLLHYANYDFFAEHPDVGMNWAIWCTNLLQAYDLIYERVCPDARQKIDLFFESALDAVRKNDEWWLRDNLGGRFNNHLAWHKLFIGSWGLFYGSQELVEYAVNGDQGARELIEYGTLDDGIWFESSINYHFAALAPLVELARELANSGSSLDFWNTEFSNGRSLRDLISGPIGLLFPDRTLPTIGDCYASRKKLASSELYYAAYDAYRLPEIAWLLGGLDEAPPGALFLEHLPQRPRVPHAVTRDWPEHSYVFLRSEEGADYWNGRGFSVFLSRDLDSIHSHRDKFGLIAYGRGAHLALDVEAKSTPKHAFSSPVQRELNRSTLCHNTVMVDGQDHLPTGEKLVLEGFVRGKNVKMASVADYSGVVCPGVRMSRSVAVTDEYILDVFQTASENEHTYDYLFHTCSDTGSLDLGADTEPFELPAQGPWAWLRGARSARFDGDFAAMTEQGGLRVRLHAAGCPNTTAVVCEFPSRDDFAEPPMPMLIIRRRACATVFITAIQAERRELPSLAISASADRHGFRRIAVRCGAATREFAVRRLAEPQ